MVMKHLVGEEGVDEGSDVINFNAWDAHVFKKGLDLCQWRVGGWMSDGWGVDWWMDEGLIRGWMRS